MAKPGDKWYDNLEIKTLINGDVYSFYCDHACIHCFVCHENAPNHFESSKDGDHSHVYNQPKTEEELSLCLEALDCCPVNAIGCDGHLSTDKKYKRE